MMLWREYVWETRLPPEQCVERLRHAAEPDGIRLEPNFQGRCAAHGGGTRVVGRFGIRPFAWRRSAEPRRRLEQFVPQAFEAELVPGSEEGRT